MELEGWRGSIHMDLAGQSVPEVVADRGRWRWRRPGRSGALGFERERGGHDDRLGGVREREEGVCCSWLDGSTDGWMMYGWTDVCHVINPCHD